jgi:hypothetical protein
MPATILSDNGVSSGSAGLKTSGANDGILTLQTTTTGGTATTAVTVDTSQNVGVGTSTPTSRLHVERIGPTSAAITVSNPNDFTGNSAGFQTLSGTSNASLIMESQSTSLTEAEASIRFNGNGPLVIKTFQNHPLMLGTNNTNRMQIANDGSQSSVIPGGSTLLPQFACRAWVNFNGTGTVAIRASGNVSSITDNGVGDYTINFTTAMPDADFAAIPCGSDGGFSNILMTQTLNSTTSVRLFQRQSSSAAIDLTIMQVAIFR